MPVLNSLPRLAMKPIPRVIWACAHSLIDKLTAGVFFASAGWFWCRNKRAALAPLICGVAGLAVNMMSDSPEDGERAFLSPRMHHDIELGLAAMMAAMPAFLAFKDNSESAFFRVQGAAVSCINELTQFPEPPGQDETNAARERAA